MKYQYSSNDIDAVVQNDMFFAIATTCPLWTSWSPLPVVVKV
jgi:hypothetical protein